MVIIILNILVSYDLFKSLTNVYEELLQNIKYIQLSYILKIPSYMYIKSIIKNKALSGFNDSFISIQSIIINKTIHSKR